MKDSIFNDDGLREVGRRYKEDFGDPFLGRDTLVIDVTTTRCSACTVAPGLVCFLACPTLDLAGS